MKPIERRDLIKKVTVARFSAMSLPAMVACREKSPTSSDALRADYSIENNLILPKVNGLRISGRFRTKCHTIYNIKIGVNESGSSIPVT